MTTAKRQECDECTRGVPLLDGRHHEPYADDGYDRITPCMRETAAAIVRNTPEFSEGSVLS